MQPMRTKISVPRLRSEFIHRDRLYAQIKDCLEQKLTMVSAPAGYGKTTLLIDFAAREEIPVCWYALDENDDDLLRFVSHFVASIGVQFNQFGSETISVIKNFAQQPIDLDLLLTTLVNELYDKITEHFVIVIDDFHLLSENGQVVQLISRLIELTDENSHFVLMSRTLMGLPNLTTLVAKNFVVGLSYEELSFNADEIQELYRQQYGIEIDRKQADELLKESEGWITGLILTASRMTSSGVLPPKMKRMLGVGLDDYLGEQILEPLSQQLVKFLKQTSVLEAFNADICKESLNPLNEEKLDWDQLIFDANQRNLFLIVVPDEVNNTEYLRYHHLFRDFLRKQIKKEDKALVDKIRFNLASYYEENQEWELAGKIFFSLGEKEKVAKMLSSAGTQMVSLGKFKLLSSWLEQLSGPIRYKYPVLMSLLGTIFTYKNDLRNSLRVFTEVINFTKGDDKNRKIYLEALSRRATTYRLAGEIEKCKADAELIIDILGADYDLYKISSNAYRELAMVHYHYKNFQEALKNIEKSINILLVVGDEWNFHLFASEMGIINRSLGNYDEAVRSYKNAIQYFESNKAFKLLSSYYNNLAFLYYKSGKFVQAAMMFEKTIENAKVVNDHRYEIFGLLGIADIYLDIGIYDKALEVYQEAEIKAKELGNQFLIRYAEVAVIRTYLYSGDIDAARTKLQSETDVVKDVDGILLKIELACFERDYEKAQNLFSDFMDVHKNKILQENLAYTSYYALLINIKLNQNGKEAQDKLVFALDSAENLVDYLIIGRRLIFLIEEIRPKRKSEEQKTFDLIIKKIKQFGETNDEIRKRVRQLGKHIPVPNARLEIFGFGPARVIRGGVEVTSQQWQANAAREMFFYIINENGVTKDQIIEALWGGESGDLLLRFKNTIYRLRHALGKDAVLLSNERYIFNRDLDYVYDVERFYELSESNEINKLETAFQVYKGEFVRDLDKSIFSNERGKLQKVIKKIGMHLGEFHYEQKNYFKVIETLETLIIFEPEYEAAYQLLIKSSGAMGDPKMVVKYFTQCQNNLKEYFNKEPSQKTKSLYKSIIGE